MATAAVFLSWAVGVPLPLLARASASDFDWANLEDARQQLAGQGGGLLVSLIGEGNHFSGAGGRTFYLASDDRFSGRLLVMNLGSKTSPMVVRVFVDYRELPAARVEFTVPPGGKRILPLRLDGLVRRVNDLGVLIEEGSQPRVARRPGQTYPLLPRYLFTYELRRRGGPAPADTSAAPRSTAPAVCPRQEKLLLVRDQAFAVVNCTGGTETGVVFGTGAPLFYRVPAGQSAVFDLGPRQMLLHASSPFTPMETSFGRPTYSRGDLVGL